MRVFATPEALWRLHSRCPVCETGCACPTKHLLRTLDYVHFAAQVIGNTADVIAAGVQKVSAIPISAAMLSGQPYGSTTRSSAPSGGSGGTATRRCPSSARRR